MTDPHHLTWNEVDPSTHPFVITGTRALVQPLLTSEEACLDKVTDALVAHHGPWACGWRWAGDEGDIGGGPVQAWCCAQHSLESPAATAPKIEGALLEWRRYIERADELFASLAPAKDRAGFERALAQIVTFVVKETDAGDAWYHLCQQAAAWFLERSGMPQDEAAQLAEKALNGKFESWIAPSKEKIDEAAKAFAACATTSKTG